MSDHPFELRITLPDDFSEGQARATGDRLSKELPPDCVMELTRIHSSYTSGSVAATTSTVTYESWA
jgi:hypothetical protein